MEVLPEAVKHLMDKDPEYKAYVESALERRVLDKFLWLQEMESLHDAAYEFAETKGIKLADAVLLALWQYSREVEEYLCPTEVSK